MTVSLKNASVTTSTEVGGYNSFSVAIADVSLSGKPPTNPPHFTFSRFIPDGVTIAFELAQQTPASTYLLKAFPFLKTADGIDALGKLVNPDIIDTTDDTGTFEQAVFAPGQTNGPTATHITYALLATNDGGFSAQNVVLTDQIPRGTKLDTSASYAPTYNGQALGSRHKNGTSHVAYHGMPGESTTRNIAAMNAHRRTTLYSSASRFQNAHAAASAKASPINATNTW